MKTVNKTYYVSDEDLRNIENGMTIKNLNYNYKDNSHPVYKNEIQISYREPERKIEITESEFDDMFSVALSESKNALNVVATLRVKLSKRIFGAER